MVEDSNNVGVDMSGNVIQNGDADWTDAQRRDIVVIGWLDHPNHSYIDLAYQEPFFVADVSAQLPDFLQAFVPLMSLGMSISHSNNLQVQKRWSYF